MAPTRVRFDVFGVVMNKQMPNVATVFASATVLPGQRRVALDKTVDDVFTFVVIADFPSHDNLPQDHFKKFVKLAPHTASSQLRGMWCPGQPGA